MTQTSSGCRSDRTTTTTNKPGAQQADRLDKNKQDAGAEILEENSFGENSFGEDVMTGARAADAIEQTYTGETLFRDSVLWFSSRSDSLRERATFSTEIYITYLSQPRFDLDQA